MIETLEKDNQKLQNEVLAISQVEKAILITNAMASDKAGIANENRAVAVREVSGVLLRAECVLC